MTDTYYPTLRVAHLASSSVVALIAITHAALTWHLYPAWTPDAVWFAGTGLGFLLLGVLNLTHIGLEPCRMPTTRLIRIANWLFAGFGLAASVAVPEPQAYLMVAALISQALLCRWTLPGPA